MTDPQLGRFSPLLRRNECTVLSALFHLYARPTPSPKKSASKSQRRFGRDDEWGYWATEPNGCCVSSIALLLLKTGIVHHPYNAAGERRVTIDYNQMATAQKLLLFWRKPVVLLCAI